MMLTGWPGAHRNRAWLVGAVRCVVWCGVECKGIGSEQGHSGVCVSSIQQGGVDSLSVLMLSPPFAL